MIAFALVLLMAPQGTPFHFSLLPHGAFERIGAYRPFALKLSPEKPVGIVKCPQMAAPRYGVIQVGDRKFFAAIDGEDKLYVDSNADGDLTDDPSAQWGLKTFKSRSGQETTYHEGVATVDLTFEGRTVPCTVHVYESGAFFGYYMDFALTGKAPIDGKSYDAIYLDESGSWDGKKGMLLIDEKGDGKLGPDSMHPVGAPFMLAGKEYEFGLVKGGYGILPSTKKIEPRTARDPNEGNGLRTGSQAKPFDATTINGNRLYFPGSFKAKVVMLDFWATWCGPCMHEVPNVVSAYRAYHDKGFEVLGVSLDRQGDLQTVKDVASKQGMAWEQVYDGKYFEAAVAKQYGIQAIPEAYLVDGDTGKVIAFGDAIRGEKLAPAIEKALAAKKGS
jgi:thiol-disulfide isomerase/thioredoxin